MNLEDLVAVHEITDVVKRLARGTDRLDEELMASCYHRPDGFDDHNVFRGSGTEFAKWVCDVLPMFEATHHFIADPYIRLDGDVVQVDTYCIAHHLGLDSDLVLGLRYIDRFEKRHGIWLIARRICAFDWQYVVPFDPKAGFHFDEDFTLGHRSSADITYRGI
ncbi:MAG: nuclear transport factor 2 family protein [Acidimicrobiales bacterium]